MDNSLNWIIFKCANGKRISVRKDQIKAFLENDKYLEICLIGGEQYFVLDSFDDVINLFKH